MNWKQYIRPSARLLCAGALAALSACTTTQSGSVAYDPASSTRIVTGKQTTVAPLKGPVKTTFLKAEISPGNTGLYLVVLYLSVEGTLAADEVTDSAGKKLQGLRGQDETIPVQFGQVTKGQVTKEIYYIPLTRSYLEAHTRSGITVYLKGPHGTLTATQAPSLITGFLAELDAKGNERERARTP
jgi:hypothetical protein